MSINYKPPLPSSLISDRLENDPHFSYVTKMFGNNSLRVGVVLEVIEIEDEKNQLKIAPEYVVMCAQQNGQGSISTVEYKSCIRLNGFGGVADYMFAKLRTPKDASKVRKSGSMKKQAGSIVLLMCLDGNSEKGIIIGSLDHPEGQRLNKAKGQHMEGEFNGVNWQVNNDGALTVTFKSATEADGKPKDTKAGGSLFKIEKDGSIEVNDGTTEKIRIDKTNKTIAANADNDISLASAKKSVSVSAGESINLTAKKDLIAAAEGKAAFSSKQTFSVDAGGAVSVKGASFSVDSEGPASIKGTKISIDSSGMVEVNSDVIKLGTGASSPAVLGDQLIVMGIGNLGGPVISNAIAGFSVAVMLK